MKEQEMGSPATALRHWIAFLTLWPSPIGSGAHGFWPLRAKMQAICFIGGAGVVPGLRLPGKPAIDFAPRWPGCLASPLPGTLVATH